MPATRGPAAWLFSAGGKPGFWSVGGSSDVLLPACCHLFFSSVCRRAAAKQLPPRPQGERQEPKEVCTQINRQYMGDLPRSQADRPNYFALSKAALIAATNACVFNGTNLRLGKTAQLAMAASATAA